MGDGEPINIHEYIALMEAAQVGAAAHAELERREAVERAEKAERERDEAVTALAVYKTLMAPELSREDRFKQERDEALRQLNAVVHVMDAALTELHAGRNPSAVLGPSFVAARRFLRGEGGEE